MDVVEEVDKKESIITIQDFPFICRICCTRRSDLRLFQEENYLYDIFRTIRKIDVLPMRTVNYPEHICDECINKLEDIASFIDISKCLDENLMVKKEVECVDEVDCGKSRKYVMPSEEITEYERKDISFQGFRVCRICSSSRNLILFEEKTHLIQLFETMRNIDVKPGIDSTTKYDICNLCIAKLEEISSFVNASLFNDRKLESVIGVSKADLDKTEYHDFKCENNTEENETVHGGSFEIVNIKEEIIDDDFESYTEQNCILHPEIAPKEKSYICNCCKKKFTRESQLRKHALTHTKEKRFKCHFCEKSFVKKHHLRQHLLTHTGEKPFKCHLCEKAYNQQHHLQEHLLTHTGERPFKCDYCEKGFTRKSYWKRHLHLHTGDKPFKCDKCDKSFTQNSSLQVHLLTYAGTKPFECYRCEQTFNDKHYLKEHLLTHIGEKRFECDHCGKGFTMKHHLQQHVHTHSGRKPYNCDKCEKGFAQQHHLNQHMLTHSGKKPFECKNCRRKFTRMFYLKQHMLTHTELSIIKNQ